MPKKPVPVNRGTQCYKYDEYGVPIPDYVEGFEDGPMAVGPHSLTLVGEEVAGSD